jgi:NAD+ synthase
MEKINLLVDVELEAKNICNAISEVVHKFFKRDGVVVGLSGGIDSSLTAALCVRALGRENVLGVLLPERESSPDSAKFGKMIAEELGIRYTLKDITPVVEQIGSYSDIKDIVKKYYPAFHSDYKYKIVLPNMMNNSVLNIYALCIEDDKGNEIVRKTLQFNDYKAFQAALSVKLRARMIHLYYYAEKNNYIVAGTTNRTEFDLGNFCKYGDGGIDFETISHLYKTQVYQMSEHLKIPEPIIKRLPSPDTCSAFVSDEEFYFSLPFDILDKLLFAFNNSISVSKTSIFLNLDENRVKKIFSNFNSKIKNTQLLKQLPPVCGSILRG